MGNDYVVIENYKGNEQIVYAGSKNDCISYEQIKRNEIQKKYGADIVGVKDYYTEKLEKRESRKIKRMMYKEYIKDKDQEYLDVIIEYNGKQYAKSIIDFNILTGDLITLVEWSKINGIHPDNTRQKLARGHFDSAIKIGRQWFMNRAEKNEDKRFAK